jgi:rod shape determining protein RodA
MRGAFLGPTGREARIFDKLGEIHWGFVGVVTVIACIGFAVLYSVGYSDMVARDIAFFDTWAGRQMVRFAAGFVIFVAAALIDIRIWMNLAYPAYALSIVMLVLVELIGVTGGGAERWLDIGGIQIQPSELMKISLILALARYFHNLTLDEVSRPLWILPALAIIGLPVVLVLMQPNLGTAMILAFVGFSLFFLAGLSWKIIAPSIFAGVASIPLAWTFLLADYQKERVNTFLDPSQADQLGAAYNITQSKIALGSGGLFGKGYLHGSQSQLNYLPEKHTDFIFVAFGEEFGLFGALILLILFLAVLAYGVLIALQARSQFARLVAMGISLNLLFYILINTSMVMGLIPVVGIPLPLLSYGGTAMITVMFGFGLLMSVYVHKFVEIPRGSGSLW